MTTSTYDGNKPAHEIENDIEETRMRIGRRLQGLGRMLEPRRFIEKGTQTLSTALPAQQAKWEHWFRANASTLALVSAAAVVIFTRRGATRSTTPKQRRKPRYDKQSWRSAPNGAWRACPRGLRRMFLQLSLRALARIPHARRLSSSNPVLTRRRRPSQDSSPGIAARGS